MDKAILEILAILQATPADYFIAGIGFVFAAIVITLLHILFKRQKVSNEKYQILNTNHMALWVMIAPDAVKWHHSGEYYIDMKALADIAESRNKERGS